MNKQFTWKVVLIAVVVLMSAWAINQYGIQLGLDLKGGTSFLLKMDLEKIDKAGHSQAVQKAMDIIGKRVNQFGVTEPIIQAIGADRILVQIPGLKEKDLQQARRAVQKAAFLEFRLVHANNDQLQADAVNNPRFVPPLGYTNLTRVEDRDGQKVTRSFYVRLKSELSGKSVERAFVQLDDVGRPYVALKFTPEGSKAFARVTSANVGRQLAIILDGELQSAPVIQTEITGGNAQITGSFSLPEAKGLASVLENPLDAPVKVLEERTVDPSLGKDSIQSGIRAALIGTTAVVVFMAVYYMSGGIIAIVALALNMLMLVGALAMFKFTLTLPGLAGIVLTVGMAVDAAVLIFERIREELAANKPLRPAIAAGFDRAWLVIFDSNFTTILTAAILLFLGSGPVKGFGVVLCIGLIANLFASVFAMRLAFDWLVAGGKLQSFRMLHVFRRLPHIDFLGVRKLAFGLSWALIILGMVWFVKRGGLDVGRGEVYGIDFKGGDTLTLSFATKVNSEAVGAALDKAGVTERFIQYQQDLGGSREVLNLRLPEGASDKAVQALQTDSATAAGQFKMIGKESVGATVGGELLKQALWAVVAALVAIMIYVAFRFGEFSYGLGALISLVHDIFMTIGWFCLTGRTFSMPVMAAILTLIGYSINDTIVVFDRIRENKKLTGGRLNYFDLINRSVNETLSRTILTAGTVFLTSVALYGFGGHVLNDFAFCFMVGVLTGTYSSIYIASPVVLWSHRKEVKAATNRPAPAKA